MVAAAVRMEVWEVEEPEGFEVEFADCEKEMGEVVEANIVARVVLKCALE